MLAFLPSFLGPRLTERDSLVTPLIFRPLLTPSTSGTLGTFLPNGHRHNNLQGMCIRFAFECVYGEEGVTEVVAKCIRLFPGGKWGWDVEREKEEEGKVDNVKQRGERE